jgi:hypothetical protein
MVAEWGEWMVSRIGERRGEKRERRRREEEPTHPNYS